MDSINSLPASEYGRKRESLGTRFSDKPVVCSKGLFPPFIDHTMLMSPSKGETAVHVCHCPSDVTVCMREVLARP